MGVRSIIFSCKWQLKNSLRFSQIGQLENTIYNFDNSVIDFETLGQIKVNLATSDELSCITAHVSTSPEIPLDAPEKFLLDLSQMK